MAVLPLSAMFFMTRKGFVYTISVDIYSFHLAFTSIIHRVLHHFSLHLASKHTAFSIKTHCV